MSERTMWDATRPLLSGLHPVRIESLITPGNPDVNYSIGWMELKNIEDWPVRPATPVRVDHYTQEQRTWMLQRKAAGGRVFLLLRIEKTREWLLFDGRAAARSVGLVPRLTLYKHSLARWTRKPKKAEIQRWLIA